jgi:hypothetical protein
MVKINNKEVEHIKTVLDYEKQVVEYNKELSIKGKLNFRKAPEAPTRKVITTEYPPINPVITPPWWCTRIWVYVVSFIFLTVIGPIVIYFLGQKEKDRLRQEEIEKIKHSAEYKNQCTAIDADVANKQKEADELYSSQKHKYDTEILPKYKTEQAEWTKEQNKKVAEITAKLAKIQLDLDRAYKEAGLIPTQYRKIQVLQFMYELMSTSDYDAKTAMEFYDRHEQKQLQQARLREEQRANQIAEEQAYQYDPAPSQGSSGGGFLSNVASTAVGVRLAQGKPNDGSGRQNLFGSAGCCESKPLTHPGRKSCGFCPQGKGCTQRGRFKVGDKIGFY